MQESGAVRRVDTPYGLVTYTLVQKRIVRLNLRIKLDGSIWLSVPYGCTAQQADQMVREKSGWISERLAHFAERKKLVLPPQPTPEKSRELLAQALAQVYPLVEPLGVEFPYLKLRRMKSQWGNCHWKQGYITLNTALARCPEELRDYVALHELVHFLHQNHGKGFRAEMGYLMPDWQERRKLLEQFSEVLTAESTEGRER